MSVPISAVLPNLLRSFYSPHNRVVAYQLPTLALYWSRRTGVWIAEWKFARAVATALRDLISSFIPEDYFPARA
jgi:hypothetical protein